MQIPDDIVKERNKDDTGADESADRIGKLLAVESVR